MNKTNPRTTQVDPSSAQPLHRPNNIVAEQVLLGTIIVNNDVFDEIRSIVLPEHFYDPVHSAIFERISAQISRNALASFPALVSYLDRHEGLSELGGGQYLSKLVDVAGTAQDAVGLSRLIRELATRRALIDIGLDTSTKASDVSADSPVEEQIAEVEMKLFNLAESGSVKPQFIELHTAASIALEQINLAHAHNSQISGKSTGMLSLDGKLGGMHRSDLLILAGRPGMGKTALATNIAFKLARAYEARRKPDGEREVISGGVVGFFSLEMSAAQLAARILTQITGISTDRVRKQQLSREDFSQFQEALTTLEKVPLLIDDSAALTMPQIASRARRLKRTRNLDLLIIDYLQLISAASRRWDSRVYEVGEISKGLKALAKELDIPVLALSQLSRQVESRERKRPVLSDLRESGSIEQDADVVMFIYREEYYLASNKPDESDAKKMEDWTRKMEEASRKAEVIIAKQRHGPTGFAMLQFDAATTSFSDPAPAYDEESYESGPH